MARDDWRIRIELEEEHGHGLLQRLVGGLSREARELAEELERERLAVSRDGETVFVYAASRAQAEQAHGVIEAELREVGAEARVSSIEHWLDAEDRWDSDPPGPDIEEELISRGIAPWEVRVELPSVREARALADELEAEGYDVVRRFHYLLVGANTEADAAALAQRIHGDVEPTSELVWEVLPQNPFAIFGGLGGTGTPL